MPNTNETVIENIGEPFILDLPVVDYTDVVDPEVYFVHVNIKESLEYLGNGVEEEPFVIYVNNKEYEKPEIDLIFETSRYAGLNFLYLGFKDYKDRYDQTVTVTVTLKKAADVGGNTKSYIETCSLPFEVKYEAFLSTNTVKPSEAEAYIKTYIVKYDPLEHSSNAAAAILNTVKRNKSERVLKSADLHPDLSSGLLVRTNPNLTGNIKLNVTEDGNAYFDTFKVSTVLSQRRYRKQKIDLTNSYSYDIRKIYKSVPRYDFYSPTSSNFNLNEIDTDKNHFVDNTYSYGCSTNDDPLYSENYSLLAPLYLNHRLPDYFCIFRVETESTNISDIIRDSKLVTYYSFSEKTNIGKYLHKHLDAINSIESPIFVQLTNNRDFMNINENSITGISVDTGIISTIKETSYKQDNILDKEKYFEEYNTHLSQAYSRNNLIAYDIINLCFMFDDPEVEPFTSNRYIGFYMSENEFIKITGTSYHDGKIKHMNGKEQVYTDLIDAPYTSIYNRADVGDMYIFALSDNGVKRITKQDDYKRYLKDKIIYTPGKLMLSTKGTALTDNFPYKEFISVDISKSLQAGNHLRFIIPQVTRNVISSNNVQRSIKSEILRPVTKVTQPVIIDVVACHNRDLYQDGYMRIPSITEDKGGALYPYRVYFMTSPGTDPEDDGNDVLDWLYNNRILYMPKNRKDIKADKRFVDDVEQKYINYYISLFSKDSKGRKNFAINWGEDAGIYKEPATKFITDHVNKYHDFVTSIRGLWSDNFDRNGIIVPGKKGTYVTIDKELSELVFDSDSFEFKYHQVARVIHTGFLVDDTDNDIIRKNIDYTFSEYVPNASAKDQTDRIINAINTAIEKEGLDMQVVRSGDTGFTIASNYQDCVFQQIYPQKSLDDIDVPLDTDNIVVNGRPDTVKHIGQTTDNAGSIFNKYIWSYLLNNSVFAALGKRKFSAFTFVKNDGTFVEFEKPADMIIEHSMLYRRFNYDMMAFEYRNVEPIPFKQINLDIVNHTNLDLLNLLHNVPEIDEQLKDALSEGDDELLDFLSFTNYEVYDIASPLSNNKRVVKVPGVTLLSNKINIYQSYAHSLSLMGICNILDFNFDICDKAWNEEDDEKVSLLTPVNYVHLFNVGSVDRATSLQVRPKINEDAIYKMIKVLGYEQTGLFQNTSVAPLLSSDIFNKKIRDLNTDVLDYCINDKVVLSNIINELLKNGNCLYSTGRYNLKDRTFKFSLLDMNIEIRDESYEGFLLSNYDFYKVQYIPVLMDSGMSKIYFIFDSTLETLTILHAVGAGYYVPSSIRYISVNPLVEYLRYSYAYLHNLNINDDLRAKYGGVDKFGSIFYPLLIRADKDGKPKKIVIDYDGYYIGDERTSTGQKNLDTLITSITEYSDIYRDGSMSYLNAPMYLVNSEYKHNATSNIGDGYLDEPDIHIDYKNNISFDSTTNKHFVYCTENKAKSFTLEDIKNRFVTDDKIFVFRSAAGVVYNDSLSVYVNYISIPRDALVNESPQVLQLPVTYQFNTVSHTQDISSTMEDFFNINGYNKNIYLTGLDNISEYNKKIYTSYSADNNGYINAYKTNKSLTDVYKSYRLYGDGDKYDIYSIDKLDIKSYFDSRCISLRGTDNGIVDITEWNDKNAYSYVIGNDKAVLKINLNQVFLNRASELLAEKVRSSRFSIEDMTYSQIKDFVINKLIKYYRFDLTNIVATIYKSNDDREPDDKIKTYLDETDKRLNYTIVENIQSNITQENDIRFYTLEVPAMDKRQYYLELLFLPVIDQGKIEDTDADNANQ